MMVLYLHSSFIQLSNKLALKFMCLMDWEHIRDQIIPVLALLETTKGHLGTRNVFLGVLEVFKLHDVSIHVWTNLAK